MAQIIKTDGTRIEVSPKNGKDFSLEELQEIVGGYIEIVECEKNIMVINEEGKLMNLPFNHIATLEWYRACPWMCCADIIVGDVLLCKSNEVK